MDLRDKVALVTGGGTGLGRTINLKLARAGADVAFCHTKSAAEAEATIGEVRALGRQALAIRADVASSADVERPVGEVAAAFGRIDVLVNDAGYTVFVDFKRLDDISEETWDRIMAVNVKGAFLCSRAVAPLMRAQGAGRIVSITSVAGLRAGGSSLPYSVSKAAGTMLVKCLALALAPEITVNAVAPGLLDTRWGRRFGERAMANAVASLPLGKLATLDDVADAVLFLVANDSMTGQTIVVDGGLHMH